ncbi:TetR/AcrR family transcriptional regulator [Actinophytocola gossypii]|uniref:TetR/AcrR family transcriptional regulator n=1 Tax=Actinophytocola gossypii TaxID=2812003 RepID=A0ABT2J6N6_9PSEU|nr:TetR/AcrR family transcriptional regulator [Actinophytocola gossypii]MCT2583521.1 TetR/AcrR family transcriptional regulator [Actinophytocola gossypii]
MSPRGGSPKGRAVIAASASQKERRGVGPMTPKGRERRTEILRAARTVFEERGFLETRVADIVAAADVAQGTFYTYFDSKEAVFAEVAQQVIETMMDDLHTDYVSDVEPVERIRRAMVRFVDAFRPNAVMIGLIEQVGTFTPEMRRLRLRLRESFVDRSARGIKRMQEDGIADPGVDPVMLAEVLGAMVDQTCYIWFFLGKPFDTESVVESLTTVWARGIGVKGA